MFPPQESNKIERLKTKIKFFIERHYANIKITKETPLENSFINIPSGFLHQGSDINKNRYRFAEQLEEAMSNIQNGMRPLVVLSELTTEKASL